MPVILTREELYELVWKKRLRDLVEPFGLSEPTIRKRCRDKNIPLPGTAYWTKLARGEATRKLHLPSRGPGMDELVSTAQNPARPVPTPLTDEELMGPVPDAPVFAQPLDEIRAHYLTLIGTPKLARDLSQSHHKIRALLAEDERRRAAELARGYTRSYDGPRFDSPFEQRRLQVLNALMMTTSKAGGQIRIWDQQARAITVQVHDEILNLRLDWPKAIDKCHEYFSDKAPSDAPLRLILEKSYGSREPEGRWEDDEAGKLERKVGPIVAEFFVQAEASYRTYRISENQRRGEWKAHKIESIRRAKERAEAEARERDEQLIKQRISHLLALAGHHHQAETIRALVESCEAFTPPSQELSEWKTWALNVASDLDPVSNGTVLLPLP